MYHWGWWPWPHWILIRTSVCTVKGQVYTALAQRKGSLCLSFSHWAPTSLIANMSVAKQTHTHTHLYEQLKKKSLPASIFHIFNALLFLWTYRQFVMLVQKMKTTQQGVSFGVFITRLCDWVSICVQPGAIMRDASLMCRWKFDLNSVECGRLISTLRVP